MSIAHAAERRRGCLLYTSIEKEGKDILIGFNPKFFIDALRVIDEETISPVSYTHLDVYKRQERLFHLQTALPFLKNQDSFYRHAPVFLF